VLQKIIESDEGYTRYGGMEETIEKEIARLREMISRNVEKRFFDLLENYRTPLSRYVNWYIRKDRKLVVDVRGECRGVTIIIDEDEDYSSYERVEVSDWCRMCGVDERKFEKMDLWYQSFFRRYAKY